MVGLLPCCCGECCAALSLLAARTTSPGCCVSLCCRHHWSTSRRSGRAVSASEPRPLLLWKVFQSRAIISMHTRLRRGALKRSDTSSNIAKFSLSRASSSCDSHSCFRSSSRKRSAPIKTSTTCSDCTMVSSPP
eukprot:Mycagemm_TRINITY_DN10349_c6_g3::TRINITY_DN10349_c6_g3_i1::g.556::m.556 type:complete len:134 gc:universal TRINITY_DN10349_c6_g3_i1:2286-1885(-)